MSSLRHIERIKLEKLLEMSGGYVLDFSDRTFRDFILESTNTDIYIPEYESGGTSKANRLRTFWKKEDDSITARLIEDFLEYWKTQVRTSSDKFEANEKNLYQECLQIVLRLKSQTGYVEHPPQAEGPHPGVFISAREIKNEGTIKGPRVDIYTESYSGKGEVSSPTPNPPISINHSNVHFGQGNNVYKNSDTKQESVWGKYWWSLIIPLVVLVFGFMVTEGRLPQFTNLFLSKAGPILTDTNTTATTTPDIYDILSKNQKLDTAYEQTNFLKNYDGQEIHGRGVYADFFNSGDRYFVIIDISVERIACVLSDPENQNKLANELMLLKKGSSFDFIGTFRNVALNGIYREVENCSWLR